MGKNCKKVVDLVSIPFAYYTWIQQTHVQINYKENSYKWYIYRTLISMILISKSYSHTKATQWQQKVTN